jgi:hypothetical protein
MIVGGRYRDAATDIHAVVALVAARIAAESAK